ncbi:MAG: hypothetical protein JWN06_2791 [Propionibacteriaceae bacterium]|jgi:hypothetical protein|nr:hypothetical protein [Propionibacteriaceae bacterium]
MVRRYLLAACGVGSGYLPTFLIRGIARYGRPLIAVMILTMA